MQGSRHLFCFGIEAELTVRSRVRQPEVYAGDHPGSRHRHGIQVRLRCFGSKRERPASRLHSNHVDDDDDVCLSASSVISMSVLYVLTLHHRGDTAEKDGYVPFFSGIRTLHELYCATNQCLTAFLLRCL